MQGARDMHDPDDRTLLDELLGAAAEPVEPDDVDDAAGAADSGDVTALTDLSGSTESADAADAPVAPVAPAPVPRPRRRESALSTRGPAEPGAAERGLSEYGPSEREMLEPGLAGAVRQEAGAARRPAAVWRGVMWGRSGLRSSTAPGCREIALTTTGFVIFVAVDSIMMYTPFSTPGSTSLLPQALTLALLAFGLGALMIWSIRGACRPVGVGMMLGWVFMTLISAGYFTGLNP